MKIIRCIAIISIIMMIFQPAVFAQGITDMAYVRGNLVAPQVVAPSGWYAVNFVALQDDQSNWSSSFFYPSHNGRYSFCGHMRWDTIASCNANWTFSLAVELSDGRIYFLGQATGLSGNIYPSGGSCVDLWMISGMWARFLALQDTGSNRTLRNGPEETWFSIVEVPMVALSQTATPQFTATPNATIPAMATIIAGLLTPEATPTMEPITETINISLAITNTTGISISRIPISNTLHTTGFIYLPNWVGNFDPIAVMASLMIFIIVGAVMRKPTLFVISWFGLSILGVFSQSGIYWVFITIVMVAAVVIYLFFRHTQES